MAPFRGDQRRKINAGSAQLRLNASNALSEEQSLDMVDMAGALPNQPLAFPMGAARIFFLDAWYSDHGRHGARPGRWRSPRAKVRGHRYGRSSHDGLGGLPAYLPGRALGTQCRACPASAPTRSHRSPLSLIPAFSQVV